MHKVCCRKINEMEPVARKQGKLSALEKVDKVTLRDWQPCIYIDGS
jgi:hypothetical protein